MGHWGYGSTLTWSNWLQTDPIILCSFCAIENIFILLPFQSYSNFPPEGWHLSLRYKINFKVVLLFLICFVLICGKLNFQRLLWVVRNTCKKVKDSTLSDSYYLKVDQHPHYTRLAPKLCHYFVFILWNWKKLSPTCLSSELTIWGCTNLCCCQIDFWAQYWGLL